MKSALRAFLHFLALLFIVLACLVVIDGVLPMRSDGPNPNWIEVIVGLGLFAAGTALRRHTRSLRTA